MRRLDSNQRFPAYETGNLTACLLRNIDEVLLRPPHRRSLAYHIWMDAYGEMQANIYVFLNILERHLVSGFAWLRAAPPPLDRFSLGFDVLPDGGFRWSWTVFGSFA